MKCVQFWVLISLKFNSFSKNRTTTLKPEQSDTEVTQRVTQQHENTLTSTTPLVKSVLTTLKPTQQTTTYTTTQTTTTSTQDSMIISLLKDQGPQALGVSVATFAYAALGEFKRKNTFM